VSVLVASPGLLSSVQGAGRVGHRHLGVGQAGALDAYSMAIANLLAGNAEQTPVIEMTLSGPTLHFERAVGLAICGATIDARVGASALPGWRRIDLPAGSTVHFGACRKGARAYLAVAGGFVVPPVLGSPSTDLRAGFGGHAGRALLSGDRLTIGDSGISIIDTFVVDRRWIDPSPDLDFAAPTTVRVLPGRDTLTEPGSLFDREWSIDAASNRQGLRLHGMPLRPADERDRLSEPVLPGTLQLPPDGQPILLLADAQTHGGYPRIGHVIAADLPKVAQLKAGDSVRFTACTPLQARRLFVEQRQRLVRMAIAIRD
jgi:antagonist of KipI